ncbi:MULTISPECIES: hypothetical protein [Thermus]|uniref:hypothetical protein n=1 Tax=Thermus TaxID=270 RepID=UPI001F36F4F6|nr:MULTISPECIES: hypothetical protein [Thermus]
MGLRLPWYVPFLLLFLSLVGLGVLATLWFLGVLFLLGGAAYLALKRLSGPRWRRLPPPR